MNNVFSENRLAAQLMCQWRFFAGDSRAYINSASVPMSNRENGFRDSATAAIMSVSFDTERQVGQPLRCMPFPRDDSGYALRTSRFVGSFHHGHDANANCWRNTVPSGGHRCQLGVDLP